MSDESKVNSLFDPQEIFSIINVYRLPIAVGLVGIVFIAVSVVLMQRNQATKRVTFIEKSSTLSASTKIRVDIEGAIERPGVYEMTMGSRVDDLLIAAGGLSSSADRVMIAKSLNRAAKLADGGKLYIPQAGDNITNTTGVLGTSDNIDSNTSININEASISQLDSLPGVGQVTAQKIISGRPYQSVDELKSRKIIGAALFEKIKDLVSVY